MNYPFVNNKYTRCYFNLIEKRRTINFTGYGEKHHVVPRSLGGNNEASNIVKLTAREHAICHLLLMRMTEGKAKISMIYAANMMLRLKGKISSRSYEKVKKEFSNVRRGIKLSDETKRRIADAQRGTKRTEETKFKMSVSHKGYRHSAEAKLQMRLSHTGVSLSEETKAKMSQSRTGVKHSDERKLAMSEARMGFKFEDESKEKMSKAAKNRQKFACKFCGLLTTSSNITRWHNEKCKSQVGSYGRAGL